MFRRVITNTLVIIGLLLASFQLSAHPQAEHTEFVIHPKASPVTDYNSPTSTIHRAIKESRFYEYLLHHPNFVKIQDMARQVWENQTGHKRRVMYSRQKAYSIKID